ncbi:MAG: signal peptidase II, partial [Dehalococcoidia bacterium]|nr:signal peptidase II [Dehalococcoidia bacterium]
FGLQFGGAIGNITDRFRLGHVTDFIDVGPWPIFNIADSSIVVGIGLLIFYFWFLNNDSKKDSQHLHSDNSQPPGDSSLTQTTPDSTE